MTVWDASGEQQAIRYPWPVMGGACLFSPSQVLGCVLGLTVIACGGATEVDEGSGGAPAAGGRLSTGGTGGSDTGEPSTGGYPGSGGGSGGTVTIEPECPDEAPPPVEVECDALGETTGCAEDEGCYPYLEYPYGEECGFPSYGTFCAPASVGEQGDFCGEELGYCSPGHMCVVGPLAGTRCARLCSPRGVNTCGDGLICNETDVRGYGVCG